MTPDNSQLLTASSTVEVTMPATGSEAPITVAAWLKQPGERVSGQEAICVVEWESQRAELASPADGVLRMVTVAARQRVIAGSTLAVIDTAVTAAPGQFAQDAPQG